MRISDRFIPACAGNAASLQLRPGQFSVHPRMRGERWQARSWMTPSSGSSPHARGTRRHHREHEVSVRFIPACAGNACPGRFPRLARSVHPRMRGEREYPTARPRHSVRFIPACAGNAHPCTGRADVLAVHPRMRGERWRATLTACPNTGSSPHARGTLWHLASLEPDKRFIPACAGNARTGQE